MYIKSIILLVIFCSLKNIAQQKNEPFAEWKKDHFEIIIDTNRIKNYTEELMLRYDNPIHIATIEVKEGITSGDKKTAYYFVSFMDNDQIFKVVKYLKKIDNKLFLVHEKTTKNDYQLEFISCRSNRENRCEPQLNTEKDQYFWICTSSEVKDKVECERKLIMP